MAKLHVDSNLRVNEDYFDVPPGIRLQGCFFDWLRALRHHASDRAQRCGTGGEHSASPGVIGRCVAIRTATYTVDYIAPPEFNGC